MIRQFRDLLEMKVKFPMKKNELGFYDAVYTEDEHDLRCPLRRNHLVCKKLPAYPVCHML
jgi:hypothetical protein